MDLHKLTLLICLASIESIYADVSDTELKSKMNALGIADEGLGANDPDLYDLLDYPREWKNKRALKNYEKQGMSESDAKKMLMNKRTSNSLRTLIGAPISQAFHS